MHPDQKYIDALLTNNVKLISELYQKCFPLIRNMVLENSGTQTNAADLFQDALVDLFKMAKNRSFTLTYSICAYLKGICRNKWYDELKKRKLEGVTFTDLEGQDTIGEDSFTLIEEQYVNQARLDLMRKKFDELGESCKELLQLSWTKNTNGKKRSTEEIAQQLHISDGYARKKKSECIVRLMKLVMSDPEFEDLKR
ncbi:MAG: sigma-70 family RNA polymerase sigma factor [Flavisolibacter sp.]|nr:sigma-70 family RNA polymerase sigma factor [Flavisolibacter sp.]